MRNVVSKGFVRSVILLDAAPPPPLQDPALATAAEPTFLPTPGVFKNAIEVTLKCDTPGATMHYTVDGAQPMNQSAVYHAPIVVLGSELTIKSFASAPGKKDSPVVTGIFRIEE